MRSFLALFSVLLFMGCSHPKRLVYSERREFSWDLRDSVLDANSLPLDLSLWDYSRFVGTSGGVVECWVYVSSGADVSILESRGSGFIFSRRLLR